MTQEPSTLIGLMSLATQALPFVKTIADMGGDAKIRDATSQILDRLYAIQNLAIEGQEFTASLQQKLAQITTELERYRDWESTASRYELTEMAGGAIVYAKKRTPNDTEAMHYLCPDCFAKRQKSFLQTEGGTIRYCKPCEVSFHFEPFGLAQSGGSF